MKEERGLSYILSWASHPVSVAAELIVRGVGVERGRIEVQE